MFTARRLPLTIAFALLLGLAFGAGCDGFFVDPKLVSIAVTPATPQLVTSAVNPTKMFATGTYDDNSTKDLSSQVAWTMVPTGFATIDSNGNLKGTVATTSSGVTLTASLGAISGATTFTVAQGGVTKITVSPTNLSTSSGHTFSLKAVDQSSNDISGSATWTFTVHNTSTVVTGFTLGTPDSTGQPFTVGTLSPTQTFPVTLDVVATYPSDSGGTITSNVVQVTITS
jgi:hypothetical protein